MSEKFKSYVLLHIIVLIFGFTGIIGAWVTVSPYILIWHRLWIAAIAIGIYGLVMKNSFLIKKQDVFILFIIGIVTAAHWVTFYQSIKITNVSVTLSCFATGSFFAAWLEPIVYKRKLDVWELFWGLLAFMGISFIFNSNIKLSHGIFLAIISAFLSALFTVLNGKMASRFQAPVVAVYEMIGGFIGLTFFLFLFKDFNKAWFLIPIQDLYLILVLALVCTAFTFVTGIRIMRHLSPYTVVLTVNLEPVYSIILAHFLLDEGKQLNMGFYFGASLILLSVFGNAIVKNKKQLLQGSTET